MTLVFGDTRSVVGDFENFFRLAIDMLIAEVLLVAVEGLEGDEGNLELVQNSPGVKMERDSLKHREKSGRPR